VFIATEWEQINGGQIVAETKHDVTEQFEQIEAERREAWFGAWECGCTDTETGPTRIPMFCPVHGEKLISDDKGRTKVQLTHSGVSGYGYRYRSPETES
jgi:hypothetical protein